MYQKANGIAVHSWYEDDKDEVLYDLTKILKLIVAEQPHDIRTELAKWRLVVDRYIQYGKRVPKTIYDEV